MCAGQWASNPAVPSYAAPPMALRKTNSQTNISIDKSPYIYIYIYTYIYLSLFPSLSLSIYIYIYIAIYKSTKTPAMALSTARVAPTLGCGGPIVGEIYQRL